MKLSYPTILAVNLWEMFCSRQINIAISISVILGTTLGPIIYLFSTEWSLLFAGLIAGTVAYLFGEKDGK